MRYRKPKDRRTRQRRWRDAVQEPFDIQARLRQRSTLSN
jgi:hypothetical protein